MNYQNKTDTKITWWTTSIYVDIDTGEIIPKAIAESKQYIIINKKKHYEINNTTGTRTITNECRRTGQMALDL